MDLSRVSIGLPGATPHELVSALAPRIEQLGLRGLWLNDTPGGDSLAGLRAAAAATSVLRLGTGVIPLDRRSARGILADLGDHHGRPEDHDGRPGHCFHLHGRRLKPASSVRLVTDRAYRTAHL